MLHLTQNSLKNKTKIGFVVTILVLASACSHELIRPELNNASTVTPEPVVTEAPPMDHNPEPVMNNNINKTSRHRKHHTVASRKSLHKSKIARKILPKTKAAASAATVTPDIGLPPAPPAPPSLATTIAAEQPAQPNMGFLDRLSGYWPYGLFAVGFAGALLFVTRKQRTKGKGRRGLIFSN